MKKKEFYVILFLVVGLGISLFFNYKQYRDAKTEPVEKVETTTETETENKVDSFIAPKPVSEDSVKKISVKKPHSRPKLELISENGVNSDSIPDINNDGEITETDSTYEIPITQKRYEDSCYVAYVSGYHANLDSIFVRHKIITNTITTTITKKKRWTFGFQGGLYLTPAGVQPGVGFGVGFNL